MGLLKFLAPSRYTVFLLLLFGVFTVSLAGCQTRTSNGFLLDQWTYYEGYSYTNFVKDTEVPPSSTFSIEKFLINMALLVLIFFYFFAFFVKTHIFKRNLEMAGYAFNYVYAFMIYNFLGNLYWIGYNFISFDSLRGILSFIVSIPSLIFAPVSLAYTFAQSATYDFLSYLKLDVYSFQTSDNLWENLAAELINRVPYFLFCLLFFLLGVLIYRLKKKSK